MLGHGNVQVIVYTKPACPPCEQVRRWLDQRGVAYETIDMTVDSDAREKVMALGYAAAPVVVAGSEQGAVSGWTGCGRW